VLVQNTNWYNVEKAIDSLRSRDLLRLAALHAVSEPDLAELIRPAGYFRVKARRLRHLLEFLSSHGGIAPLASVPTQKLRTALLAVHGIGPETADSILLYAMHKPVFVVDAYSRRLLRRHGFSEWDAGYDAVQKLFMQHLPAEVALFNEYHALIVQLGKDYKGAEAARQPGYPLADSFFFL
ncbi:MAG: endonuclease III domain-containing protein, partial [Candidatus Omnitrophica bacterium]|nr:endonuclease III domain-containing protein [Candidatus Omnitrophota bacterium]